MQLIIDSEPGLAIEKDMSTIDDIEKVGNGNIEKLNENNCNGNKENIGDVNVIANDQIDKQNIDADVVSETQSEIKSLNSEPEKTNGLETKETEKIHDSVANGEETKESQNNSCNGKNGSTPLSAEQPIEKKHELIVCESITSNSKVNNTDQNKESAVGTTDVNNETSTVTKPITGDELTSADNIVAVTNNVKAATDKIEAQTDSVEMLTDDVEAASNEIEADTDNVEAAPNKIKTVTDEVGAATDNVVKVTDDAEAATDATDSSETVTDTVNLNKPASESAPVKVVETEVALSSLKDDVEVIEEPVKIIEDLPDVMLSKESENTKNNEKLDLSGNNKKDEDSTMTVDISDTESGAVVLSNEAPIEVKDDMDVEVIEDTKNCEQSSEKQSKDTPSMPNNIVEQPVVCKLSNTLDILSDDDDEEPPKKEPAKIEENIEKQCINIEDDDDIMLIDEDSSKTETPPTVNNSIKENDSDKADSKTDSETGEKPLEESDLFAKSESQGSKPAEEAKSDNFEMNISEKQQEEKLQTIEPALPLIPENFLKSAKKNIADMTREDLEEFCILKIVESIVDRSSLSDIKQKLKSVAQGVEEYRKKVGMLTKQNLDLQVVLKSIQEEQKKVKPDTPITPLKITRSVGMQVFMEKTAQRRKNIAQPQQTQNSNNTTQVMSRQGKVVTPANTNSPRPQKPQPNNQNIPVPRLVPANSPAIKSPSSIPLVSQTTPGKTGSPMPNGVKNPSPLKAGEKRQHSKVTSVTVDLTDDEPPAKVNNRTSPAPPVRVVPSQNLMAAPRQSIPVGVNNSPRKVYIPISGQQNQNIRPGQTIMLKAVGSPGLRPKGPTSQVARVQSSSIRMTSNVRPQSSGRHPAPLPDAMKQYQPPNWKALPPAPEIKLSKVENGIVISWKIESYQEDCHEEIASYQLYAYQETSFPPSTTLWKKIGDVKALPLPMACTLTQFMAGFKYYFAVRAVDIRSRLGPFSLPGSILLLNKL
ncbi:activating transcription factor 7-interacting protein 1 [Spodoptera litura]|uniref:Activating transcription factor 7-interacting protein 1 n=1 Tax=Spodoptera litura TaxID=69820 RepID=A0A9J7EL34_SPOLT|nr:activating transcription factor 7-interacting protein 1 [Spodoptera litura]XP_022829949.1 activating transcription factor 7-interacting protein 1 [Spodoptera litura]XP_022829951.1 activating transcription factor 7-interacting protein 1 [Spodoptera litura]XP_022829952.1 activating transcription factor 7-interacting protein 1 [Spodoptera litura]XP_022829953.1 activating transcription factor 7-interacting protein 1 [Spodoptera litura]